MLNLNFFNQIANNFRDHYYNLVRRLDDAVQVQPGTVSGEKARVDKDEKGHAAWRRDPGEKHPAYVEIVPVLVMDQYQLVPFFNGDRRTARRILEHLDLGPAVECK